MNLALLLCQILFGVSISAGHYINTNSGPVNGEDRWGWDSRFDMKVNYTAYVGIPYAEPPVGEHRFQPPRPKEKWSSLDNYALPENRVCCQLGINRNVSIEDGIFLAPNSDEDCLMLNVFTPAEKSDQLKPVMVWMHGGAFVFGSGSNYGPVNLLIHDIIIVTVNYRLGPLGFLSLGTNEIPGNAGLFDQRMAMQWVQDNIKLFGGDPDQVTLAGQSAGSFSATYHLFSPESRGLFQRVIGQSGAGGFSPAYHHYSGDQAIKYGHRAAQILGCDFGQEEATTECLKNVSPELLQMLELPMEIMTQPVVDAEFEVDHKPFFPLDPKRALIMGKYNYEVDVLYGATKDEGLLITQFFQAIPSLYSVFSTEWDILGPFALFARHHTEITEEDILLAYEVLSYYVGEREDINADHMSNMTDMLSDAFFWYGIDTFLRYNLLYSTGGSYQYLIEHEGFYHLILAPGLDWQDIDGVGHADELYLEWDPIFGYHHGLPADDLVVSKYISTMWTNFIKVGNPTPGECTSKSRVPCDVGFEWLARANDNSKYLVIDTNPRMEQSTSYQNRMSFWNEIWNER